MAPRSLPVDALKVLAAQLIVLHHLVLYAPMAEVAAPLAPSLTAFLQDEARWAVQVFLVIGGYLAALGLAQRRDRGPSGWLGALLGRYRRLAPMLLLALLAVLGATAALPDGRWPEWVTPWPDAASLLAHAMLLQDVLGIPSLSAGVWYVAIDLQLFALLHLGAAWLHRRGDGRPVWHTALPWAVAVLALGSLVWFNTRTSLDAWAPYFFASYGLGVLAAWAPQRGRLALLFGAVWLLHVAAGLLDERPRLLVAAATALLLLPWAARTLPRGGAARFLAFWSEAAYGVFVIHYSVIVVATALWLRAGLQGMAPALALLAATWLASLVAGAALHALLGPSRPKPFPGVGWSRVTGR